MTAAEGRDDPRRGHWLAVGLLLLAVGPLLLAVAELLRVSWPVPAQTDDAYISYRYAQNLVAGFGLVYNPGDYVEGITNLFWALLVAAGIGLGFEAKAVGHALGVVSGSAALWLALAYARTGLTARRDWAAGIAPLLLVSFVSFAYWTTSGMETPLFAAFVTATLLADARDRPGSTVAFAFLATFTRPDGALVAAVVLGFRALSRLREERTRALRWLALYGLLLSALTLFRLVYFGSPVPNTFFAKVGGVPPQRGVDYALGFFVAGAWLLFLPAALALRERRWWPAGLAVAVTAAYAVGVGGDAFPHQRFFVPVLPALAVLAVRGALLAWDTHRAAGGLAWACVASTVVWNLFGRHDWQLGSCLLLLALLWALAAFLPRRRLAPAPALAVLVAAALWATDTAPRLPMLDVRERTRTESLAQGRAYNESLELLAAKRAQVVLARDGPEALVATGGIGAFGYLARVPIVDLYGLVDREIARSRVASSGLAAPGHMRSNADYVFARKPVYLLIPRRGTPMVTSPAIVDIWGHPELEAHYEWDDAVVGYRRKQRR